MGQSYSPIPENKSAGTFLDAALKYHAAGLKVIPFWTEPEGKKGFPKGYAQYRTAQTEADVRGLFAKYKNKVEGIALLCTDGIEAVDIDVKHDPRGTIATELETARHEFGLSIPHLLQQTKSGGFHMIYRCPEPGRSEKLARRKGQKEAMIETRGTDGILFVTPTPGYEFFDGDLTEIPEASQNDRDKLIQICRHLDESAPIAEGEGGRARSDGSEGGLTPWDDFNQKTKVLDLLIEGGWREVNREGDYIRLNRPGAKHSKGVDGSVIEAANLFRAFSTSTDFDVTKYYGPSAVFAVLECRGDFSEAGRELRKRGFGDQPPTKNSDNGKRPTGTNEGGSEGEADDKGEKAPIVKIENYLKSEGVEFRYNKMKNCVECRRGENSGWVELTERAAGTLEAELMRKGFKSVSLCVNTLFRDENFSRPFDPMETFLKGVKWDGKDHIGDLCGFVDVDPTRRAWFDKMFRKHLVRLVACATGRLPFNKQIFVFQGGQGDGKTSFVRFLIPPELFEYITEHVDFSNKDGLIALTRNYIINLDELSSLSRHDINQVKAFLSTQWVKARLPFDRRETVLERRCTFFATTNAEDFLTDTTGNVRWLVMPVKGFKHDNGGPEGYAANVDIRQVYAQAAAIVAGGDYGELSADEIKESEGYNGAHMKRPLEYDLILTHFEPTEEAADFTTLAQVNNKLANLAGYKGGSSETLGRVFQMLHRECGEGWQFKKVQRRVSGTTAPVRGYFLKERAVGLPANFEPVPPIDPPF